MEYINKIELQGMTGKSCRVLTQAGEPYGFLFHLMVDHVYPGGDTIDTQWFNVVVIPTKANKLAGFVFQKDSPLRVKGRIMQESTQDKYGRLERVEIRVEATEAEYLEPENKKED